MLFLWALDIAAYKLTYYTVLKVGKLRCVPFKPRSRVQNENEYDRQSECSREKGCW